MYVCIYCIYLFYYSIVLEVSVPALSSRESLVPFPEGAPNNSIYIYIYYFYFFKNIYICTALFSESETGTAPLVQQGQQLPRVVQVIARHSTEAKRVQVTKSDGGERHSRGRDLVQLGHVRVLQVEVNAVHADEHQEGQ